MGSGGAWFRGVVGGVATFWGPADAPPGGVSDVVRLSPVVAKRRAFSPVDMTGLKTWHDSTVGVTAAATKISSWTDQSGNRYHGLQATPANQATLTPNKFGTATYVSFPTGAECVVTAGAVTYDQQTIVVGMQVTQGTVISECGGGNPWRFNSNINWSLQKIGSGLTSTRNGPVGGWAWSGVFGGWTVTPTPAVFVWRYATTHASSEVYRNDALQAFVAGGSAQNATGAVAGVLAIGALTNGTSGLNNGHIRDHITFDRYLTPAEMTRLTVFMTPRLTVG